MNARRVEVSPSGHKRATRPHAIAAKRKGNFSFLTKRMSPSSMRAEALPLLPTQTGVDEDRLPLNPACDSREGGGGGPRPAWTARIGALVTVVLVLICGAALAVYTGPGSRASLGKSSAHHSHLKSSGSGSRGGGSSHKRVAPSSSSFSSSSHSSKGGGDTKASAAVGTGHT